MSTAMKYRKKPVVNEAMQWTGDNADDVTVFVGREGVEFFPRTTRLFVAANKAWLDIEVGEWIIRDSKGFYPCKADVFAATYERAERVIEAPAYTLNQPDYFYPDRVEADPAFFDIVFDGAPGPSAPRFVEIEDPDGHGVKFGEWIERPDGYWALRIERPLRVEVVRS